ncbi:protein of unknown function [Methylorubrum extorquens DM4]|uniref:Uncharacterized protein n=1 Tax=Methylorubrum extorquens (strain DSM 6343 / CIP 106787 / DM4) TaxID=661410 RepID=C7CB33_METED|nr:protein of unknown function [Methylorubrum extorquens DM4]
MSSLRDTGLAALKGKRRKSLDFSEIFAGERPDQASECGDDGLASAPTQSWRRPYRTEFDFRGRLSAS